MLTKEQKIQYETFGFAVLKGLFSQAEAVVIREEFEAGLAAERGRLGTPELPTYFSALGPETPFMASLPEDPRFVEAAEQMWGEDVVAIGSAGQRFTGADTYWHPDLPEGTPETKDNHQQGVKFAFYLESLDADTGALRLIPGSFRSPFHDEIWATGLKSGAAESGVSVKGVPAFIWRSEPEDVLAFNLRTWHASWGGSSDRRQGTVVYYNNPKTEHEREMTREMARWIHSQSREQEHRYASEWLANPEGSVRRRRWIEWLDEYGFLGAASPQPGAGHSSRTS